MDIKITYPSLGKRKHRWYKVRRAARWPVLAAAVIPTAVNLLMGGKAWSVIVLMGLYMAWDLLLSPDLIEYNRISQFIKLVTYSCVLLILIEVFLARGWAVTVVPIVGFGGLIVAGILFFTDLERQKQNMQPMLLLTFGCLVASVVGLCIWGARDHWPLMALGGVALALLAVSAAVLGRDFTREFKRRFHTK